MKYDTIIKKYLLSAVAVFLILGLGTPSPAEVPEPPGQPASGPGGSGYSHGNVSVHGPYWADALGVMNKNNKYLIYMPDEPVPESAPVVLFLHGWAAIAQKQYYYWIQHIVRQGYIVVWVQYQRDEIIENPKMTLFTAYVTTVIKVWRDALKRLDSAKLPVKPEKDGYGIIKTAFVGHSVGAYLCTIIAGKALKLSKRIPIPYAVVAVEPGIVGLIPSGPFDFMHPDTRVVLVVGDEDDLVCKSTAVAVWNRLGNTADENKDFLLVVSDYHGFPQQIAHHYFPNTSGARDTTAVDARDFYVTFKLSVGALNCAFKGTDCEYALGNGSEQQVSMGQWSDGQPVQPMVWIEDPNFLETTCQDINDILF